MPVTIEAKSSGTGVIARLLEDAGEIEQALGMVGMHVGAVAIGGNVVDVYFEAQVDADLGRAPLQDRQQLFA